MQKDLEVEAATPTGPGAPISHRPLWTHSLWLRLAGGVLVAVLGTLLLVKVVGGSNDERTTTDLSVTPSLVLNEVTHVDPSVFDAIGVSSPTVPIVAPSLSLGRKVLTVATKHGARLPLVVYVGTEYCAFCAAERWPLVVALSRFGTFSSLYDMQSSPTDFAPNTPTFTFYRAHYSSKYVAFHAYEVDSDVLTSKGYVALMHLPRHVRRLLHPLDPTMTYPIVDFANLSVEHQASLSPITFAGLSRDQIAAGLNDTANPVTRSVIASANYVTASICLSDGDRPTSVCRSRAVRVATHAMRRPR